MKDDRLENGFVYCHIANFIIITFKRILQNYKSLMKQQWISQMPKALIMIVVPKWLTLPARISKYMTLIPKLKCGRKENK